MASYSPITNPENSSSLSTIEDGVALTPQQRRLTRSGGLAAYKDFAFGEGGLPSWMYFEFAQLFAGLPGVLGYGSRTLLYPGMFRKCGRRPAFGRGVTFRRPAQMSLGSRVLIDDYASLEVRGKSGSIEFGERCSVGRLSTIVAKDSSITLGAGCNIGSYCRIASESGISIGESVLVGAYSYIGAGNHQHGSDGKPLIEQPMERRGGVRIGAQAWIGAGAMIMDGVVIGERAIIGAQSLVLSDVPPDTIVIGSPARVLRNVEG